MRIPRFTYHRPGSLEEAAATIAACGDDVQILAGGTELFPRMKLRLAQPKHLLSLSDVKGLDGIHSTPGGGLAIGAGLSLASLVRSPLLSEQWRAVREAAGLVASEQIRNMATVGGNLLQNTRCLYYNRSAEWRKTVPPCIKRGGDVCHAVAHSKRCFAAYQGDLAAPLIALGAKARLLVPGASPDVREMAVEDMFTGDGKAPLAIPQGSILVEIILPGRETPVFSAYRKFRLRDGVDFPLAGAAIALSYENGTVRTGRICLTGISSSPLIVKDAADLLAGQRLGNPELIGAVAASAFKAAHPVENLEETGARRRAMVKVLVEDLLFEALGRAG